MAQRYLIGCNDSDPMWMSVGDRDELRGYVDRGPVEEDPLLRLVWDLYRLRIDVDPGNPSASAGYAFHAAFPYEVYSDKAGERLVGFYGFRLDRVRRVPDDALDVLAIS